MAGTVKIVRGIVIEVNLDPTTGSETGKTRPCIVVTNNVYNERVPVIQVVPLTAWTEKKSQIRTNITVNPDGQNGLSKRSVADCLQTRPIDYAHRSVRILGNLTPATMREIDAALKIVFDLT
ncbi:MAG: type II toxin-antitoxin system PemK/MazF family toxin [Anaerolineales bacterium]|nr:type II toxin-antitoxin system PemK/MazF family toxin [Anaerolineales bacterium]